jgi:hypothetical protein
VAGGRSTSRWTDSGKPFPQRGPKVNDPGSLIGKEDVFESAYTDKFRLLVGGEGEFIQYDRDRVAIDIGLHLTTPDGVARRPSHTRIWFQLKGMHEHTLHLENFQATSHVTVRVKLEQLRFWFASPEPIYIALYVQAANKFLAEDVRELVYRQWGEAFLAPGTFPDDQREVTVKMRTDAVLTPEGVALMRRHQSMRIDGPFFRGRPLGHRLDPLRCSLNRLEPAVYVSLVKRLLAVHDYRVTQPLDPELLFGGEVPADEHVVLSLGKLYNTFEWVTQLFTEFGTGPEDDFRGEGAPQSAQGEVAVCIHGQPQQSPCAESLDAFARRLLNGNARQLLVFANTEDPAYFGSFFGGFRGKGVECISQGERNHACVPFHFPGVDAFWQFFAR